jgi:hypothetical protein
MMNPGPLIFQFRQEEVSMKYKLIGNTYYEKRQDSYHCQLESFHKQSKICLCSYISIITPKFTKVFLNIGQDPPLLLILLYNIHIESTSLWNTKHSNFSLF